MYRDFISPSILKTELGIEAERKQYDEQLQKRVPVSVNNSFISDLSDGIKFIASKVTGTTPTSAKVKSAAFFAAPTNIVSQIHSNSNHSK